MSSFIATLAANYIQICIKNKVQAWKRCSSENITVYFMGTISGIPLNSDLGQNISDSCLVLYRKHKKKRVHKYPLNQKHQQYN